VPGLDAAVWDRIMAVNVRAPMLLCKHVLPAVVAQGTGAIVNTSSVAALAAN
jgi:NAD(P)-dependent dehydrogenase (short-subunit alcohol dehydrogenase family)